MAIIDKNGQLWELDPTRQVDTGVLYRFGVIAPSSWTPDQTKTFLNTRGWDVQSVDAPYADIAASLLLLQNTVGLTAPAAYEVTAFWRGTSGTLPTTEAGQLYYSTIEARVLGPPAPPASSAESAASYGWKTMALVGIGAYALGYYARDMMKRSRRSY